MTPKRIVTIALLLFVAGSVVFLVMKGTATAPEAALEANPAPGAPPASASGQPAEPRKLVATYFHGNKRCNTCRTIQAQVKEALEGGFPDALMSGALELREVNLDLPGNDHYATDYALTGSSLVLTDVQGGKQTRFKVLQDVWTLWADQPAFVAYVQRETRAWLEPAR